MEQSKESQSDRIQPQLIELKNILGDEIVDAMTNDPDNWSTSNMFEDKRFVTIERDLQDITRRQHYLFNKIKLGHISDEQATKQKALLAEEMNKLSEREDYPVWKAYNQLQTVRTDIVFSKEK